MSSPSQERSSALRHRFTLSGKKKSKGLSWTPLPFLNMPTARMKTDLSSEEAYLPSLKTCEKRGQPLLRLLKTLTLTLMRLGSRIRTSFLKGSLSFHASGKEQALSAPFLLPRCVGK